MRVVSLEADLLGVGSVRPKRCRGPEPHCEPCCWVVWSVCAVWEEAAECGFLASAGSRAEHPPTPRLHPRLAGQASARPRAEAQGRDVGRSRGASRQNRWVFLETTAAAKHLVSLLDPEPWGFPHSSRFWLPCRCLRKGFEHPRGGPPFSSKKFGVLGSGWLEGDQVRLSLVIFSLLVTRISSHEARVSATDLRGGRGALRAIRVPPKCYVQGAEHPPCPPRLVNGVPSPACLLCELYVPEIVSYVHTRLPDPENIPAIRKTKCVCFVLFRFVCSGNRASNFAVL